MRSEKTSTTGRWTRGRQEPETSARNDKKQKNSETLRFRSLVRKKGLEPSRD